MTACWQQVGAVLKANALLSRARLSIEASIRLHAKSIAVLPTAEVLTFASPLDRPDADGRRVGAGGDRPDEPARRIDRPGDAPVHRPDRPLHAQDGQGRPDRSRRHRRRLARQALGGHAVGRSDDVRPDRRRPASGAAPIERADGQVDLAPVGLPVLRTKEQAATMLAGAGATFEPVAADRRLTLRSDLRQTGFVTSKHVAAIRELSIDTAHARHQGRRSDPRPATRRQDPRRPVRLRASERASGPGSSRFARWTSRGPAPSCCAPRRPNRTSSSAASMPTSTSAPSPAGCACPPTPCNPATVPSSSAADRPVGTSASSAAATSTTSSSGGPATTSTSTSTSTSTVTSPGS